MDITPTWGSKDILFFSALNFLFFFLISPIGFSFAYFIFPYSCPITLLTRTFILLIYLFLINTIGTQHPPVYCGFCTAEARKLKNTIPRLLWSWGCKYELSSTIINKAEIWRVLWRSFMGSLHLSSLHWWRRSETCGIFCSRFHYWVTNFLCIKKHWWQLCQSDSAIQCSVTSFMVGRGSWRGCSSSFLVIQLPSISSMGYETQ